MTLISCENVSLGYDGRIVSENMSFTVNSGDYLCIVGENGSGKSTLMKTLLGLNAPISGKIQMDKSVKVGYLPQQSPVQRDFPASVYEVVMSGALRDRAFSMFYTKKEKEKAEEIMKKLKMDGLRKRCYRELSGGQQQRTLLARALLAASSLIILDEPCAGLDPAISQEVYEAIEALNKEGMTIIMVSHDMPAALKYASHILHVGKRPLFFGSRDAYIASGIADLYLGREEAKHAVQ